MKKSVLLDEEESKMVSGGMLKKIPEMKPLPWYKTIYNEYILKLFNKILKK